MSSQIAALRPLLMAASLVLASSRSARAGIIVNFGQVGSPTATLQPYPFFEISYDCFPLTPPGQPQHCDDRTLAYGASPFAADLFPGVTSQAISISSFKFFGQTQFPFSFFAPINTYNVYMGTGSGSLTFFGTMGPGVSGDGSGNGTVGSSGQYLYNPTQGALNIRFVETVDEAGSGFSKWWFDGGLVTQFTGDVVATPEPSTLVLLATGLIAVAGIRVRRRRRSNERQTT